MADSIQDRLRAKYPDNTCGDEAADELDRLTARIEELENGLRIAIDAVNGHGGVTVGQIHDVRALLGETK